MIILYEQDICDINQKIIKFDFFRLIIRYDESKLVVNKLMVQKAILAVLLSQ
jgi:hypothetical protein